MNRCMELNFYAQRFLQPTLNETMMQKGKTRCSIVILDINVHTTFYFWL